MGGQNKITLEEDREMTLKMGGGCEKKTEGWIFVVVRVENMLAGEHSAVKLEKEKQENKLNC